MTHFDLNKHILTAPKINKYWQRQRQVGLDVSVLKRIKLLITWLFALTRYKTFPGTIPKLFRKWIDQKTFRKLSLILFKNTWSMWEFVFQIVIIKHLYKHTVNYVDVDAIYKFCMRPHRGGEVSQNRYTISSQTILKPSNQS